MTKIVNVKQSLTFMTPQKYDEIMCALQSEDGVKNEDIDEDMASLFDESEEEEDDLSRLWTKDQTPRDLILQEYRRHNERKAEMERELQVDDEEKDDEEKILREMYKNQLHGTEIEPGLIVIPEIVSVSMQQHKKVRFGLRNL